MRCWDGGATFFTCKHQNYHLLDNLCWCDEKNKKLISTDYFSFPSPFVDYWNGDLCRLKNEYQRCDCGRLYRDFEFLENRPFSIKGRNILEIKEKIKQYKIKEVRCSMMLGESFLEIVTSRELCEKSKKKIKIDINNILGSENLKIKYLVEDYD
jgi:hypothetical protein